MASSVSNDYLETQVLTASPQKLQLMLIDGALRSVRLARRHWENDESEAGCHAVVRAQQIVTELLAGLNHQIDPKLVRRVASIYVFVFRSLVDAALGQNPAKLDDALRVLEVERETWRQVCRELSGAGNLPSGAGEAVRDSSERPLPPVDLSGHPGVSGETSAGFSLDA